MHTRATAAAARGGLMRHRRRRSAAALGYIIRWRALLVPHYCHAAQDTAHAAQAQARQFGAGRELQPQQAHVEEELASLCFAADV